jgi:type IV pilus assembly protein PilZ
VRELRRYTRAPLDVLVEVTPKGSNERLRGKAHDISLGGMFIEMDQPLAFRVELVVHVTLPGQTTPLSLPAVVRWTRTGGMGVQFGLIGARETHAITEVTKEPNP